jgi:regulator of protease activity HflC (stomatin/prohibitin superfamily)
VPHDRAILVRNQFDGTVTLVEGPIAAPLTPLVEDLLATIPLYDLSEEISVKDINTNARHNIDEVRAHIRYNVFDPQSAFKGIPKRAQAEELVLKEIKEDRERALHDLKFWEKMLGNQMHLDAEDVIRAAIFDKPNTDDKPYSAAEVYDTRRELTTQIKSLLNARVKRWGVQVSLVELDYIKVDGERFRALMMDRIFVREARQKGAEAEREANRIVVTGEAQAKAEAMRVQELIRVVQDSGVELSADELREIVIDAIRASSEMNFEGSFGRHASDSPPASKPAGGR